MIESRRQFLKCAAVSGAALGLAACRPASTPAGVTAAAASTATPPLTPEPIVVTRVVEVTRIVQPTPAPTHTPRLRRRTP